MHVPNVYSILDGNYSLECLFICNLFNNSVSSSDSYTTSGDMMVAEQLNGTGMEYLLLFAKYN